MANSNDLVFILRLLDDDSPAVTQGVTQALLSFGNDLWPALDRLPTPPTEEQIRRIRDLLDRTSRPAPAPSPDPEADFGPGKLVRNRELGYRGVVVAIARVDPPSPGHPSRRRVRPRKDQPWYHVLVDGSTQVVRVAEEDLEVDNGREPVRHPLLDRFFDGFDGDVYRRNGVPWA